MEGFMKKSKLLALTTAFVLSTYGFGSIVYGASDPAVVALQQSLQAAGYSVGAIDGVYGPQTEAAVMSLQADYGLQVDGIVGPATTAALEGYSTSGTASAGTGTTGTSVSGVYSVQDVQEQLLNLGYNVGSVDGIEGARTTSAVQSFQAANGLQADGIIGPATLAALGLYSGGTTTTATTTTTAAASTTASGGYDTTQLQTALQNAGYSVGNIDGVYGARTDSAVRAFQAAAGLKVDGIVGPATLAALGLSGQTSGQSASGTQISANDTAVATTATGVATFTNGGFLDTSSAGNIIQLQQALQAAGYSLGSADGIYGDRTDSAVRAFQAANGLTADGIVGPATLSALGWI